VRFMGRLLAFRAPETPASPTPDEDTLVERCRARDRDAMAAVLSMHADMLERVIVRLVGPGPDAEDVLHATLVAAMDAFPTFRGEARLSTWLSRIAVHVAIDALRHHEGPDQALEARRQLTRLSQLLDELPPLRRVAFVLFAIEGRSLDEVAALTGATVMATKSRVFWARRSLLARAAKDPVLAARFGRST
jgi:RNA polymerase sigma-70 factor, ECF subfamily